MTLKKETREELESEIKRRLKGILELCGVTDQQMEDVGLNDEFFAKQVDEIYLKHFTPEEIEEFVSLNSRLKDRNKMVEKDFENALAELLGHGGV